MKILSFLFSGEVMAKCICDDDCDDDCFTIQRSIKNYRSILGMLRARPRFSRRRKIVFFLADFACFCVWFVYSMQFCEKRVFGRLRSWSYSRERIKTSLPTATWKYTIYGAVYISVWSTETTWRKEQEWKWKKPSNKIPKIGAIDYWAVPLSVFKSVKVFRLQASSSKPY